MDGAPTSEFDTDTRVVEVTPSHYRAQLTDRWHIGDKPNGGYVLATIVRAMQLALHRRGNGAHPDPLTVTGHYLRPSEAGPADIHVDIARVGRQLATISATFSQMDRERVRAIATFGDLGAFAARGAPTDVALTAPDLPPVEQCVSRPEIGEGAVAPSIRDRMTSLLHPATGWISGQPTGRAEVVGWLGFADGREPDTLSMPLFADAMPPAVFELLARTGWVPTVELTVHVRGRPAPGLLRTVFRTRNLRDGLLEEDGEVWDADGRLVAQSRQLAMLLG
jgi:acyl-coenzyme A thioesterase PaaI-like protein